MFESFYVDQEVSRPTVLCLLLVLLLFVPHVSASQIDVEDLAGRDSFDGPAMKIRTTGNFETSENSKGSAFFRNPQITLPPNLTGVDGSFTGDITDGYTRVEAVAVQPDGKIVVGGTFPRVNGVARPALARLNADGSLDNTFNSGPAGSVYDIVIQPDGKILVAGFSTGIARLNSDGSFDATFMPGTGTTGAVQDVLLLPDGKILISGSFTQYNGTTISRVARLNANGGVDTSFTPPTINSTVWEAARQADGKVIIVGAFSTVGGVARRGVARLDTNGSLDISFDAGTALSYNRPSVAIQPDGQILVGGVAEGLVRLNPNGTLDPTFTAAYPPSNGSTVHRIIILPDGKILAGGAYNDGSDNYFSVVKFNSNGSLDTSFTRQQCIDGGIEVFSIDLTPAGKIVAVGDLYKFGSLASFNKHIAQLNSDGTIDTGFIGSIEGYGVVYATAQQPDGKILVGGNFETVNGSPRRSIVRFNSDGTVDTSFIAGTNNDVFTIAVQPDGKILIGGQFSLVNNTSPGGEARLNVDGSIDPTFSRDRTLFDFFRVNRLVVQPDGKILVGGGIGTQTIFTGIIRLNSNGTLDNDFTLPTTFTSDVYAISLLANGKIYIGGAFTNYLGSGRNRVALLNSNGTVDSTFNTGTGPNSTVRTIARQPDGKVLIGGDFASVNSVNAVRIARLNTNGSVDPSFNTGLGFNSTVYDLVPQLDGQGTLRFLVGGFFTTFNGTSRIGLARINTDGSLNSLDENISGDVRTIAIQSNGKILIGGGFYMVAGQPRNAIARLNGFNRAPFDFDGDGKTDVSIFRPSVGEWWYLKSSDGGNGALQFGSSTDRLAPADYTGDGKTDIAFFNPSTGFWFILRSENFSFYSFPFGAGSDIPVPADYDGDGKADPAVFRPSSATWFILNSSGGTTIQSFGANGDRPVPADYDGDRKADLAIFRPSDGSWWLNRSQAGIIVLNFGTGTDKTVPGDYTGDGKADVAFFRPSSGEWFISRSEDFSFYSFPFGAAGDIPAPGDYDGDGKIDPTVFRASNSTWFKLQSTSGFEAITFGSTGDIPVPSAFVR